MMAIFVMLRVIVDFATRTRGRKALEEKRMVGLWLVWHVAREIFVPEAASAADESLEGSRGVLPNTAAMRGQNKQGGCSAPKCT